MTKAGGSFEVAGGTEDPYDELVGGIKLTHASGTQAFSGDVTGEGAVHWLMLYRAVAPESFNAQWLQWHRSMQTLLQASRAFIYQEPGWHALLESRLTACERLAASLRIEGTA